MLIGYARISTVDQNPHAIAVLPGLFAFGKDRRRTVGIERLQQNPHCRPPNSGKPKEEGCGGGWRSSDWHAAGWPVAKSPTHALPIPENRYPTWLAIGLRATPSAGDKDAAEPGWDSGKK
jgi:hypothetical protein